MSRLAALLFAGTLAASPALAGKHHTPQAVWEVTQSMAFGGATLGVAITEINPQLRAHFGAPETAGVLVGKVLPGSAAQAAGLRVGDVIVRMAGVEISNGMVLRNEVQRSAGGTVSLDVLRDGKLQELNASIAQIDKGPKVHTWSSDDVRGDVNVEIRGMEDLHEWMNHLPQFQSAQPGEFDDLHLRIDDLEQQLLEMTERMEQATDRLQERLDALD